MSALRNQTKVHGHLSHTPERLSVVLDGHTRSVNAVQWSTSHGKWNHSYWFLFHISPFSHIHIYPNSCLWCWNRFGTPLWFSNPFKFDLTVKCTASLYVFIRMRLDHQFTLIAPNICLCLGVLCIFTCDINKDGHSFQMGRCFTERRIR